MPPPRFLPWTGCLVTAMTGPVERAWNLSLTMCLEGQECIQIRNADFQSKLNDLEAQVSDTQNESDQQLWRRNGTS